MPTDAAGLTQNDVAEMSLRQELLAYRDHYEHMQQLLNAAQLKVHDGEWEWAAATISPGSVGTASPHSPDRTRRTATT